MSARKMVGEVWVDSGQVMIVDPCYLDSWGGNDFNGTVPETIKKGAFSYQGACEVTCSPAQAGQLEHGAVVSSSGYGDGVYPVYAEFDGDGVTVNRLTIDFTHYAQGGSR